MSDKPISERLQVKGDRRLAVVGASAELDRLVGAPRAEMADADVVLVFVRSRAEFGSDLPRARAASRPAAILWVAYPKLTSPLAGDLNRDVIRGMALDLSLDTVSQIAIDDDWSAMRLKRLS